MSETFFGDWSVSVLSKNAAYRQRIVIRGSGQDGEYDGVAGGGIARVAGNEWALILEGNNDRGSGWQPSAVRRSAAYTLSEGLVVRLNVDDGPAEGRDGDYDDLIVELRSLDAAINLAPLPNPFDFSVPKRV